MREIIPQTSVASDYNTPLGFVERRVGNIDTPPRSRFEIRDHSPNRNDNIRGTYSYENFTTQINTHKNEYLTFDESIDPHHGIWLHMYNYIRPNTNSVNRLIENAHRH